MKIDHLVVNCDSFVQEDELFIKTVHSLGLPYEPKRGKGTKGFKVSNVWIGNEYFEFVHIKSRDGGGWVKSWTEKYHCGHRGVIGFALEVANIESIYQSLISHTIDVTAPEPLKFRWFFNLLSKTMPWKNSYLPEFEGVPLQFFLQQLNDEKSKTYIQKHMVPNSKSNNINGISKVEISGAFTEKDKNMIKTLFQHNETQEERITVFTGTQMISFIDSDSYKVEVELDCTNSDYSRQQVEIGNLLIRNN